jgi:hypothetical protein
MELVFFKSNEHPDYYIVYKSGDGIDAEKWVRKLNNIGEFENSGYDKVDVSLGFVFKTDADYRFFEYLIEHVATNCISHPFYDGKNFRGFYEFKDVSNPEKWLEEFKSFENKRREEFLKAENAGKQMKLF